jgi:hypothetical protein
MCPNWRMLREHRMKKIRKEGLRQIERELEIARFIRKQKTMTTIIKASTINTEHACIKTKTTD